MSRTRFSATEKLPDQPVVQPVLGHVPHPEIEDVVGAQDIDPAAVDPDRPLARAGEPDEGLGQFGLAVPLDAGQRVDLAGPDLQRDVVDQHDPDRR